MRFFGFCILALTALGCSSAESAATTADASPDVTDTAIDRCHRVDGGACCEGETRTRAESVDGTPCTILLQCSGGRWLENADDCHFIPEREPPFGAPCTAGGACTRDDTDWCATLLPDPICLAPCTLPAGSTVGSCADGKGVCLGSSGAADAVCMPRCTFGPSTPPTGCSGANGCAAVRVESSASGPVGVGICSAGCRTDGDCGTGRTCQPETGLCMAHVVAIAKPHGAACVPSDFGEPTLHCACYYDTATAKGYCANVCHVGADACPAGSTCDPLLPGPDDPIPFPGAPPGLLGRCLKTCTTDADCAAVGAKCRLGGGMTTKTCRYERPSVY